MIHVSGGGGNSPHELAYAEITAAFILADITADTEIPGLSFTLTVPVGDKFYIEMFSSHVEEDSGSTAGNVFTGFVQDETLSQYASGNVVQVVGGFGDALVARGGTQLGDGEPHTYSGWITMVHTGPGGATTNGVIVNAGTGSPAFIRAVAL